MEINTLFKRENSYYNYYRYNKMIKVLDHYHILKNLFQINQQILILKHYLSH